MSYLDRFQTEARKIALWSWGLMAFSIPFSTFLTLTFSAIGAFFTVLGLPGSAWSKIKESPIVLLCLLLFAWLTVSMTWGLAPTPELLEGWVKYRKLLFVPVIFLMLVANRSGAKYLVNFFLLGCGVTAIGVLFAKFNIWALFLGAPDHAGGWGFGPPKGPVWFFIGGPSSPSFGRTYIAPGLFFSAALALVIEKIGYLYGSSNSSRHRPWIFLFLVIIAILFLGGTYSMHGRTGFILTSVVLLGGAFYALRAFSTPMRLLVVILIGLSLTQFLPQHMQEKFARAQSDIQLQAQGLGGEDLDGRRAQLWHGGVVIGLGAPVHGVGVGGFKEAFGNLGYELNRSATRRAHPHSEYVLLFAQGGVVALLLFVSILVVSFTYGYRFKLFGLTLVLVLIAADASFNSVVWDLAEGHFFSLFVALLAYRVWYQKQGFSNAPTG